MKRVVIVHGWDGSPATDWLPWVKSELERHGFDVLVPEMPNASEPVIEEWVGKLTEVVNTPDINTYFIGHSIGCQAILRYVENIETQVGGAVFVAGWFDLENLEDQEVEEIAQPWIERPIDLISVNDSLPHSTLIISDNDPYGAFDFNVSKFEEINSSIVVMPEAGHLTGEDGYQELPEVLDELGKLISFRDE